MYALIMFFLIVLYHYFMSNAFIVSRVLSDLCHI